MKTCPQCAHQNAPNTKFCERCGSTLGIAPLVTRPLDPKSLKTVFTPVEEGTEVYLDRTQLVLNLGSTGQEVFVLGDGEEVSFGRGKSTATQAIVNFGEDLGWESGMSRLHAAIQRQGNRLYVLDLGSTNGTYVNHQQLTRHEPTLLHDGDCLRFGLLDMRVRYIAE